MPEMVLQSVAGNNDRWWLVAGISLQCWCHQRGHSHYRRPTNTHTHTWQAIIVVNGSKHL